jgi:hypothetical protein
MITARAVQETINPAELRHDGLRRLCERLFIEHVTRDDTGARRV